MMAMRSSFLTCARCDGGCAVELRLADDRRLGNDLEDVLEAAPVIWSENDIVRSRNAAALGDLEIAIVKDDAKAPSGDDVVLREQALSDIGGCRRRRGRVGYDEIDAGSAQRLMPPAALISSATSSMPLREFTPDWAFAPESGRITPTLTALPWAMASRMT